MGNLKMNIPKGALKRAKSEAADGGLQQAELEAGRRYNASVVGGRIVKVGKEEKVVIDIDVPEANDGKGGKVGIFYSLEEDRLRWLLMDLAKLGFDIEAVESGDDIEEILASFKKDKPGVRIKTVQGGEYVNVRIDRLLKDGEEVGESSAAESDDEDEDEKPAKKAKKAVVEDEEDDEAEEKPAKKKAKAEAEDDEDEEEAEEKPKKKAKKEEAEEDDEDEEAEEKPAKKSKKPADDEDEEEDEKPAKKAKKEEPEDKEVVIEAGLKCKATIQGKEQKVEILEVFEKEEKVRVKVLADDSVFKISTTKLSL